MVSSLKHHTENCVRVHCYCQDVRHWIQNSVFRNYEEFYEKKGELVPIILLYLEDMLINSKFLSNRKPDKTILYCYLEFILNYLGRSTQVILMLGKLKDEIGNGKSGSRKERTILIEFTMIQAQISNNYKLNLKRGDVIPYISQDLTDRHPDNKQEFLLEIVRFFNQIKEFKRSILK